MDWKALLFIAVAWAILAWMANRSAFFPMPYPDGNWFLQKELNTEDVWLRSGRHRIHGWWKPLDRAPAAVLFLHGNAGNVTHRARHILAWQKAGAAVLVIDYRGYGKSQGRPSEAAMYEDALAAYRFLTGLGFPPGQILIHGESLGTVPAAHVASQAPVGGLILEAPFPSARAVANTVLPLIGPLLVWGLDVNGRLARVRAPLLVIHGDRDEVIPYRLGRQVFDAAREPKEFWTIPGAGHNDIPETAGPEYPRRLRAFLEKALQHQNISPAN